MSHADTDSDPDAELDEAEVVFKATDPRILYVGAPLYVGFSGHEYSTMTITKSDGDSSSIRPDQEKVVDENGNVKYEREAELETKQDWFKKVATYLVHDGNWHPKSGKHYEFCLSRFPDNYKLYMHYEGNKDSPRTDAYLRGSAKIHTFRSPQEFAPHASWLIFGCPKDDKGLPRCGCKYCFKVKQKGISKRLMLRTAHLKHGPVTERRQSAGERSTSVASPMDRHRNDAPHIMAKDYTHINEDPGGHIPIWEETPLPPKFRGHH